MFCFAFFCSPTTESKESSEEDSNESTEYPQSLTQDTYLQLLKEYHHYNMKILQLEEWKLRHACLQSDIGLPPGYEPP